ncbi:ribulose-phosphate 3-epimerase [Thermoproteota archaeon]
MKPLIVPAIIAKSQNELEKMLQRVIGKVERVQLDIMDGDFVPNKSLDFDFEIPYDFEYEAHLMVKHPFKWIDKIVNKVDIITVHVESIKDIEKVIDYVTKEGRKINLALIPETKYPTVIDYMGIIDGILVMTVDPGSYCINKEFNLKTLQKIRQLREIDSTISIEVDGCMNPENARLTKNAGANIFTSGSYIFKSENVDRALKELKDAIS